MTSIEPTITIEDSSFSDFVQKSFSIIKNGIKTSNSLPTAGNFNFYSCFPTFNEIRNKEIKKIVHCIQCIIEKTSVSGNIKQRDVEEKFDLLLESNDIFLDRANMCLDEESGVNRNPSIELIVSQTKVSKHPNGCWNTNVSKQTLTSSDPTQTVRLLAGKNIQRPQLMFKDKIDNSNKPWQPRIKDKPNSLKPLTIYMENDKEVFCHPYEWELDKFEPSENQLTKKFIIKYKSLEETPLIMIEKVQDLKILLNDLQKYEEIAVDLEHHSYRSFQGITCLMQISTRDIDYLIDTLTLRSELYILNEIFTKASVLKIFHGSDSDILWLQRDLSLYIVNMFDTHQAAKQLELPFLSLSYLLRTYCQLDPNKHFQLADWRIRPLPAELIKYAREDTHYLLYIKDVLNNALIDAANGQSNILKAVYTASTELCKKTYEKPIWTENSYLSMYRKSQKMFNNQQLYALKELHKWRNETARMEDDSTNYVLPNHMLLNIAEILPREMQGILACCNPIPPLVRQNLLQIHKMILKARDQPLIKSILKDDMRLLKRSQISNSDSWICAPHDIPNDLEARANLPCLLNTLNTTSKLSLSLNEPKLKPIVTLFDNSSSEDEDKKLQIDCSKKKKLIFISPFERYKRVQPIIVEEEKKEREAQEQKEVEQIKQLKERGDEETAASIKRVHDHFIELAQQQLLSAVCTFTTYKNNVKSKSDHIDSHNFVLQSTDSTISNPISSLKPNMNSTNIVDTIIVPHVQTLNKMPNKKRKRQLSPEIIQSYKTKHS